VTRIGELANDAPVCASFITGFECVMMRY
jgi:hypothetical protein